MKFRISCSMLLVLVLLFGVALSVPDAWMCAAFAEGEEQVLVFKTFGYQYGFSDYVVAEAFNRTHPGKKIIVEEVPKGEALVTELMSGEADYILNTMSTGLDATKCSGSGIFVDLYEWMDADPDFHREDYFENLFEAMEYEGHLYGIVSHFQVPVVFLNKTIADAIGANYEPMDSISIEEILNLYEAAKAQGLMDENTPLYFKDEIPKMLLLEKEFIEYVDLNEKQAHFSDAAYVELLERTKAVYSERRMTDGTGIASIPDDSVFGRAIINQHTSSLFIETTASLQSLEGGTLTEPHEALVGPLFFTSASGKSMAYGGRLLMVPTSCSNQELAWEFIKFCISPLDAENGETPITTYYKVGDAKYFPVSKKNLAAFAEQERAFGDVDFASSLSKLEVRIGEIEDLFIYTRNARLTVEPILEQYFDYGTISAEECARQMDERLFLYLNE